MRTKVIYIQNLKNCAYNSRTVEKLTTNRYITVFPALLQGGCIAPWSFLIISYVPAVVLVDTQTVAPSVSVRVLTVPPLTFKVISRLIFPFRSSHFLPDFQDILLFLHRLKCKTLFAHSSYVLYINAWI